MQYFEIIILISHRHLCTKINKAYTQTIKALTFKHKIAFQKQNFIHNQITQISIQLITITKTEPYKLTQNHKVKEQI